jgi:hypothetical protein
MAPGTLPAPAAMARGGSGDKPAGSLLQPGFLLPKSLNPRLGRRVFYASGECFVPRRRRHKTPAGRNRFPHRRRHPETGAGYQSTIK